MEAIVLYLTSQQNDDLIKEYPSWNCWQFATVNRNSSKVPGNCSSVLKTAKKKTLEVILPVIQKNVGADNVSTEIPTIPSWYKVAACYKIDSQAKDGIETHFIRQCANQEWYGKPSAKIAQAYQATVLSAATNPTVKQNDGTKQVTYNLLGIFYIRQAA